MAHNFQGYDGYFILQYLHKNGLVPEVIMRGAKILTLNVPVFNIKFVDSLCFIPMSLANFPKTFGLNELSKGYFPHYFNTDANQNYEGPLPDASYYNPDSMSPGDRTTFYAWQGDILIFATDYNILFHLCFAGKFAQKPNMTKVKLVSEPEEYFDMLTSDEIEVTDASFVSDDVIELRYENKENFVEPNARTNVVIAAFTTAHARLKL